MAAQAGVKRLVLFHHDPAHADRDIEKLVNRARRLEDARRLGDVSAAQEGATIELGRA